MPHHLSGRGRLVLLALALGSTAAAQDRDDILRILHVTPSAESLHYVAHQQEFQLHTLLTEQRHPVAWDLSARIQVDTAGGLRQLFEVDEDIDRTMAELAHRPEGIEKAVRAVVEAITLRHRIYVYGCGATGRLAKQMESGLWRPFWTKLKAGLLGQRLQGSLPEDIEDRLIGEMTGADRALISSLEGFEDLQLIGRLQLGEHGIQKGDAVFCITEGGETSSVIGTVLAAAEPYGEDAVEAGRHVFFLYNNPDHLLRPFARCRAVLDHPGISRINLTTGPQAITGSTRMQATTSETWVMGVILEEAIGRVLAERLSRNELAALGFRRASLPERLGGFSKQQRSVAQAAPELAHLTDLESDTYRRQRFSTYFADRGLITVFIDSTERSPTFRLLPLDTVKEPQRRCWIEVVTPAESGGEAWLRFLGRPFRGLAPERYRPPFADQIADPYLREAALRSLDQAGDDQSDLYDFSMAAAFASRRAPQAGDLGLAVLLPEELPQLRDPDSSFRRFLRLISAAAARPAIIAVVETKAQADRALAGLPAEAGVSMVPIVVGHLDDPLGLRRQLALKMALNAHSTAVMARLGRVIGNTMTFVSPSNLKLVGRATFLTLSHVNHTLASRGWRQRYGGRRPLTYAEANAVLFSAKEFVRDRRDAEAAEVALSIIRILEGLKQRSFVSFDDALSTARRRGLEAFLRDINPSLEERGRR